MAWMILAAVLLERLAVIGFVSFVERRRGKRWWVGVAEEQTAKRVCTACGGKSRIASPNNASLYRKAGNASYLKSLEPGQMSMRERGRLGGRPHRLTLADIAARDGTAD